MHYADACDEESLMHKVTIPEDVIARVVQRRGAWHAHADVSARATGLVVVDLQNYFMAPGQQVEIPMAREIVPNVNRLARALREAGGRVIWIRTIFTDQAAKGWSHFHAVLNTAQRRARRTETLREGAFGAKFWPALDIQPGDVTICKTRYSALIPGSSDLEAKLREHSIEAVWIAGTATSTCCESTARDAMLLDFRTTMVSDANADESDLQHSATLTKFCTTFGDVASTDELVARLQSAQPAQKLAATG
jgi:ureidoacrylate peracid hydrolase